MPSRPSDEEGITNFGRIPAGVTFEQATRDAKPRRKYTIDPHVGGHRLTLCDTLRQIHRIVEREMPPTPERALVLDYLAACFDFGKRMDARMKELKGLNHG